MNSPICDHLRIIGKRIKSAEIKYLREPGSVSLLAVSKRHPVTAIEECHACGQYAFGENYAQEMQKKALQLSDNLPDNKELEWHYIGPIQSNKTRLIADTAHWIHSIDRYKIAKRISEQRTTKSPINLCLQVNVSEESSKSGFAINELPELTERIQLLPNVVLRGLMAIPAPISDFDLQRQAFAKVRKAMEGLNQQGYNLDTLSMGMSGDMEAAIAEGATIVRIGTAIFGQRPD